MCGPVHIPLHITALYIFAVINMTLMWHITLVEATVIVLGKGNDTLDEMQDKPAAFGPSFPDNGLWGHVRATIPQDGCTEVQPPPPMESTGLVWIALIKRYNCNFDEKVLNAQKAGFGAVLVHNVGSDSLIPMGGANASDQVKIPSGFIGESDAMDLILWETKYNFLIVIDSRSAFDPNLYLIPFAVIVGICFVLMVVFMVGKWILEVRRKRKSRLSKTNLKKIPVKKFKKGDKYDVCAICLDEYETGEKLRVLPCSHTYHTKCVDPWLTRNKKTCPVCKQKVIPGDDSDDSDSDLESEDSEAPSENTPLLTATVHNVGVLARMRAAFENSGLPGSVRSDVHHVEDDDSTDSEEGAMGGSDDLASSTYQSQAEVHNASGYGAIDEVPEVVVSSSHEVHEDEDTGDEDAQGAVGGVSVNCVDNDASVDSVDDHYRPDHELQGLVGNTDSDEENTNLLVKMFRKNKPKQHRDDSNPQA